VPTLNCQSDSGIGLIATSEYGAAVNGDSASVVSNPNEVRSTGAPRSAAEAAISPPTVMQNIQQSNTNFIELAIALSMPPPRLSNRPEQTNSLSEAAVARTIGKTGWKNLSPRESRTKRQKTAPAKLTSRNLRRPLGLSPAESFRTSIRTKFGQIDEFVDRPFRRGGRHQGRKDPPFRWMHGVRSAAWFAAGEGRATAGKDPSGPGGGSQDFFENPTDFRVEGARGQRAASSFPAEPTPPR